MLGHIGGSGEITHLIRDVSWFTRDVQLGNEPIGWLLLDGGNEPIGWLLLDMEIETWQLGLGKIKNKCDTMNEII